jgi:hypothetical protein
MKYALYNLNESIFAIVTFNDLTTKALSNLSVQFKFQDKILCQGRTNLTGVYGCMLSGITVNDKLTVEVIDQNFQYKKQDIQCNAQRQFVANVTVEPLVLFVIQALDSNNSQPIKAIDVEVTRIGRPLTL